MGEVAIPGTYTLSSFASVFHALYSASGVNKIGSLRSIKVVRNGDVIADLDVYGLLMNGKMKYAGSFTGDAYKKAVRIVRKSGREHQIYNVDEMDYSVFRVEDGDVLTVDSVLQRFENRVEVRGAVYREGLYQLNGTVNTVKQLIKQAEGIRGDAFLNRAIIDRERDDLSYEIIQVDVKGLLNGTVADIPLQRNDVLYILSIHDLKEEATLTIHDEVASPGTYLYSDNMTVEDLILQSGGLLEAAATTKIEIAR